MKPVGAAVKRGVNAARRVLKNRKQNSIIEERKSLAIVSLWSSLIITGLWMHGSIWVFGGDTVLYITSCTTSWTMSQAHGFLARGQATHAMLLFTLVPALNTLSIARSAMVDKDALPGGAEAGTALAATLVTLLLAWTALDPHPEPPSQAPAKRSALLAYSLGSTVLCLVGGAVAWGYPGNPLAVVVGGSLCTSFFVSGVASIRVFEGEDNSGFLAETTFLLADVAREFVPVVLSILLSQSPDVHTSAGILYALSFAEFSVLLLLVIMASLIVAGCARDVSGAGNRVAPADDSDMDWQGLLAPPQP